MGGTYNEDCTAQCFDAVLRSPHVRMKTTSKAFCIKVTGLKRIPGGGCQNYGPVLDLYYNYHLIFRVPKKGSYF